MSFFYPIHPIIGQTFFQNEPQIAKELLSLQQKLQNSSSFFLDNNLAQYGGMRSNSFFFQSSFVQMQYFNRNPFQQQLGQAFLEDPLIKMTMTQVPIELVKKYPDSVREIALQYLSNQPDLLFLRTSSNASLKIISEGTLYWMQMYGPTSHRLEYLQKFVSVCVLDSSWSRYGNDQPLR
jgi:hypothetical protein